MKIDSRQIAGFLKNPGSCRLVVLHGEDEGLIRERAQDLTKRVAGSLNDPFLVVELIREGWAQIPGEMAALSMIGGRRVVRVRDGTDAVAAPVQEAMKGPGQALLIVEAPHLGKGKLRSFAEAGKDCAAIACYQDEGRALMDTIRANLAAFKVRIDAEALEFLSENLAADRCVVRSEIEKLALLVGPGGEIDATLARACTGEAAGAAGDDAVMAAMTGQIETADAAMEAAIADGLNGVGALRIALMQLQKMHKARLAADSGMAIADAVASMRPPVFFKAKSAMTLALSLWSSDRLLRAIEEARQVELACKQTGSRPELLARRFVATLARQASARRKNVLF